jgi:hypothetical protein
MKKTERTETMKIKKPPAKAEMNAEMWQRSLLKAVGRTAARLAFAKGLDDDAGRTMAVLATGLIEATVASACLTARANGLPDNVLVTCVMESIAALAAILEEEAAKHKAGGAN